MKKFQKNNSLKLPFLPNKKQGQNFIFQKNFLQKIVRNCPIEPNTIIIEIGSGYGTLTNLLAETNCQKVISYEKDEQLFRWLLANNQKKDKIVYHHKDILLVNWPKLCSEYKNSSITVVGNLPYYLANSLIINLLTDYQLFNSLVFLVQKEVAQRWVASPYKYYNKYSALSVFVNFLTNSSLIFNISSRIFTPLSAVDGALVVMKIRPETRERKEKLVAFWHFLKRCFYFRRKTLWNNLRALAESHELEEYFHKKNYQKNIRPQDLSVEEYWNLFINWNKDKNSN